MTGQMVVVPERVPANGQPIAEITVYVFQQGAPAQGMQVEIVSSRNQTGNVVDVIEGPLSPTDSDGIAVAFLGSEVQGEATLQAKANGGMLCEGYQDGKCVQLQKTVVFYDPCEDQGLTGCDGECVDLNTNRNHCGRCGNSCAIGLACVGGECNCEDTDHDGYGAEHCGGNDCDDQNQDINPGAMDSCNLIDDDCDGSTDQEPDASDSCQDGDVCNGLEVCNNATCDPGTAPDCNDNNLCTDDSCDPVISCVNAPNNDPCDDNDPCTYNDACADRSCGGITYVCDDGNPCTIDSCNGDNTCTFSVNSDPCDDNDLCTHSDVCSSGSCLGVAYTCEDDNPCTDNVCHGDGNCSFPPNTNTCNDGVNCTENDVCSNGECHGTPNHAACNDNNLCTDESCDLVNGCVYLNNNNTCNDVVGCTENDICAGGACHGTPNNGLCNDLNPCTSDTCDLVADCVYAELRLDIDTDSYVDVACPGGNDCNDSNPNVNPGMTEGPKGDSTCSDTLDNDCNGLADANDPMCVDCFSDLDCNDGDPCNGLESCDTLINQCQHGTLLDCNDNDICTGDSCIPRIGCMNRQIAKDTDGDGYIDDRCPGGDDCDDAAPLVNPAATEVCDTVDNNCDGLVDQRLCAKQAGACAGAVESCLVGVFVPCDYTQNAGFEWVEVACDSVDNDCDECTDEGCPGYSNPIVEVEVIPYSAGPNLRRISGNGQFGPIGAELPSPLVVQLNDVAGNPAAGELVAFSVEPGGALCYGTGGTFMGCVLCPMTILQVCNDIQGVLVGDAQVRTDANGQASIGLRLPASSVGMTVVSATAAGQTVYFFAASVLGMDTQINVPTSALTPEYNPAMGPLNQTQRPAAQTAEEYVGNPVNYTLLITELLASTGSTSGVPSAPLAAGGTMAINGIGFADSGNRVWIGGVEPTILSESATSITVEIPEGMPGAAPVAVSDGSSTLYQGGSGDLPSVASAPAHFLRLAPKSIFIFADTGSLDGSLAKVKLLGKDVCGNPLPLAGRAISLWGENPDGTSPASAVGVGIPDPATGVADVTHLSSQVRSAVIVGSVDGLSSKSFPDGNTVVSTVPHLLSPPDFAEDPDLNPSYTGGVNSLITRGGDESDMFNMLTLNPALSWATIDLNTYTIPDGTGTVFETEANLAAGTLTGEGILVNLPGGGESAIAGTALAVLSGGASSLIAVESATISVNSAAGPASLNIPAMPLPGWMRQGVEQQIELSYGGLLFMFEARQAILRLMIERTLP